MINTRGAIHDVHELFQFNRNESYGLRHQRQYKVKSSSQNNTCLMTSSMVTDADPVTVVVTPISSSEADIPPINFPTLFNREAELHTQTRMVNNNALQVNQPNLLFNSAPVHNAPGTSAKSTVEGTSTLLSASIFSPNKSVIEHMNKITAKICPDIKWKQHSKKDHPFFLGATNKNNQYLEQIKAISEHFEHHSHTDGDIGNVRFGMTSDGRPVVTLKLLKDNALEKLILSRI